MKKQQFAGMGEGDLQSLKHYEKIGTARPSSNGHDSVPRWRKTALVIFLVICSIVLGLSAVLLIGTGFFRPRNEETSDLGGTRTSDLIELVCNKTLYFDACNSSLSSNPASRRANMLELTKIAVELSLDVAKRTADLSRKLEGSAAAGGALKVCAEVLQNSVDELNDSLSAIARLDWIRRTDDVKSWLSAALTNPATCSEGFEDVDENIPASMKKMLDRLSHLVSNALAIFNYVASEVSDGSAQKILGHSRRLLAWDGCFSVG